MIKFFESTQLFRLFCAQTSEIEISFESQVLSQLFITCPPLFYSLFFFTAHFVLIVFILT